MTENGLLLELVGVGKAYPGVARAAGPRVLDGLDLRVSRGESLAVIGPSGCGKSTLLNIIAALDRPTSGKVLLAGRDLSTMTDAQLAALRGRQIGLVFQLHHLLPQCTILENVLLPTLAAGGGRPRAQAQAEALRLLKRVGLSHRLHHRPGQLSGGECQRAAVVRALINSPRLVLADEPTGSLDRTSADALGSLLVELNRDEGVTLIVVTHSLDLAGLMGRRLELRAGKLTQPQANA
jgi:predicted ABC-type transport system involved in lysophospholipase L1 biosynthesis ATPase subunit